MATRRALEMVAFAGALSYFLKQRAPQYSIGLITTAVVLFTVQVFLLASWKKIIHPRYFSPLRNVPQPPNGHWLLGQTRRIVKEPSGMPMREWAETIPNNGLIRYSTWMGERLLVSTPKALGEVLVTKNYDFVKPPHFTDGLGRILGIGILLAEGDEHKRQRKNLMPAFAYRHIKNLYPVFWNKSREMVECISAAAKSDEQPKPTQDGEEPHAPGAIEVGDFTSRATLDIIGVSGMGQDFNALQDPTNKLNRVYREVFNPGRMGRIMQVLGLFIPVWILRLLPVKRNEEMRNANLYIKQVCRDLIAGKRARLEEQKTRSAVDIDILSVALESGGFSDEDLVNQMMTFLVAGHETTATAMLWAVYLLCKHPEAQSRLRKEVRSKLTSLNGEVNAADVDNCAYLNAVCSEVLRVWAPVALTMRVAGKDTSIQGQFVPKGMTIILCPWAINTSPELWGEDAKEFKPERWLDAEGRYNKSGSADSNYSFLTFLHGPRSCIGQKFAEAEFACLLAAWFGRFETRLEDGGALAKGAEVEIKGGITSKPKGGLWVQLKELDGW
ncbi:cytochrome P450 78A3 [Acrodontium crateriforme]|uniref:Cytochrome P450 78A3 n=1 Tax=Acrodontium crateriforme TaxID=150365 RepID=A0AAQ3M680_9PEZI|nr:cytochrome P450 78A3 [Acrodontium crateriforme]